MSETIGMALLIFVGYMAVYALVDRICKCFENCAIAKIDWKGLKEVVNEHKN